MPAFLEQVEPAQPRAVDRAPRASTLLVSTLTASPTRGVHMPRPTSQASPAQSLRVARARASQNAPRRRRHGGARTLPKRPSGRARALVGTDGRGDVRRATRGRYEPQADVAIGRAARSTNRTERVVPASHGGLVWTRGMKRPELWVCLVCTLNFMSEKK